jgi:hypothetical protein
MKPTALQAAMGDFLVSFLDCRTHRWEIGTECLGGPVLLQATFFGPLNHQVIGFGEGQWRLGLASISGSAEASLEGSFLYRRSANQGPSNTYIYTIFLALHTRGLH